MEGPKQQKRKLRIMKIDVNIIKAQKVTYTHIFKMFPAYAKLLFPFFSGGKVLFDLRVQITKSGKFLSGVTAENIKVKTFDYPPPQVLQTVTPAVVDANGTTDYTVQAFA
jgi:hypothetical protein